MAVSIGLNGYDPLIRAGNLEYRILVAVEVDKSCAFGRSDTNLNIGIGQTRAIIAEAYGNEITLAPILYQSLGAIIVVLQSTRDLPPANAQAFLNVSYGR